jgi:hydroxymethylpyrimidine pyrophosphatase-like HAD family hydrolase
VTVRRRAIFLDVDGTIIDHSERLAPSVIAAVRGARAQGHLVFLCTGRARAEISTRITDIGFDGAITAGGGYAEFRDQLIAEHAMPPELLSDAVGFFERERIEYILQAFDAVYPSVGLTDRLRHLIGEELGDWGLTSSSVPPDLGSIPSIAKLTFFGEGPTTFARVRDALAPGLHVLTGTMPYLGETGGEVSPPGMNKGVAIAEILAAVGLSPDDAVAIGDSANDIEMLTLVGLGIAMGNADGTVKAVADEVTTAVDDDGVWNAFVRHGLVAPEQSGLDGPLRGRADVT